MKIALVHDQLQEFGGAERVFLALTKIYPEADIYTAFINEDSLDRHAPDWKSWNIYTSWAARIPAIGRLYSPLRFLAPYIWESFDFSSYDLVISSSGWYMCKGIKTTKPTLHISYMHHPPRYLYGYETAVEWQKYWPVRIYAKIVNRFLTKWDFESSQRPDYFIANSEETQRRIQKFYKRESTVIYPSVDVPTSHSGKSKTHPESDSGQARMTDNPYYVTVSRLAKAKHIDLLIKAANEHKFNLKIVGSGRDLVHLQSLAGNTVEFITNADDARRNELVSNAKAFLFASVDEEFGIAPVEAMGYGTPVIALKSGGLVETVHDGKNGYLFEELTIKSIYSKIKRFESLSKDKYLTMRKTARSESEKYSSQRFNKEMIEFVNSKIK